jgi:Right handed beta helix region
VRTRVVAAAAVLAAPAVVASAWAHVERPAYWPDPAPDRAVNPAAGGGVPAARTLASAQPSARSARQILKARRAMFRADRAYRAKQGAGNVRVVCQTGSLSAARSAIQRARQSGYRYRPSEPVRKLTAQQVTELRRLNTLFFRQCGYRDIQPAVTASGNNDRVVVMPGVYTEPESRAKPTHDPACMKYQTSGDHTNEPGALSYAYQFHCPNDQNLIAVIGRALGPGTDPSPPRWDRHGIPNTGRCIRCNLQIEGSVPTADDTVIEAGKAEAGNGGPSGVGHAKDVGIRADRADGFVLRDITARHATEHNIYVLESDGYRLERFKTFYPGLYGVLTFVEDHGLIQNCEAVGGGDSGLYPGAPVETGEQRPPGTPFRYNQELRYCDMHHNLAGYSATDGNAVHVHHNRIYDNSLGIGTDVATAAGHPGFPGDSSLFERNDIYSNNFNTYSDSSDVKPAFPYPVGTGLWIAGGNNHTVRNNRFWDNWRRGTMLFAVPDALVCGPATGNEQAGCDASRTSTSHRNRFYDNVMGIAPDGSKKPNGLDFWWDSFPGNQANCWYDNRGAGPIKTSPGSLPACDGGRNPDSSTGTGDAANEGELAACAAAFETENYDPATCPWFVSPSKPGSAQARAANAPTQRARMAAAFAAFCRQAGSVPTCRPFASR